MKSMRFVALGLAFALVTSLTLAQERATVKSGPQVGEDLAGPFHPLNINGKSAGKKNCLYCENGSNPVAMIFARQASPELTNLVKKIDAACAKNASAKLNGFVVFCSGEAGLEGKLKKAAQDADLKHVILSIDNPAGPEGYKVARDADVTVVLYVDRNVKANHAFKKGELKDEAIGKVLADLPKILSSK